MGYFKTFRNWCRKRRSRSIWFEFLVKYKLQQLEELIMANKQEVLDAIEAKKQAVIAKIQQLQDQINNGSSASAADLDEIKAAVEGIPTEPAQP